MKTVLIEKTSKNIKLVELIVLAVLFRSLAAGLGAMYLCLPLGIAMFGVTGVSLIAFCGVRIWRWWEHE